MQENLVKLKSDLVSIKKNNRHYFVRLYYPTIVYIYIKNLFILFNNTFCDLLHKQCNKNELLVLFICFLISNNIYSVKKLYKYNYVVLLKLIGFD